MPAGDKIACPTLASFEHLFVSEQAVFAAEAMPGPWQRARPFPFNG
jgi:hypothetical protein